MLGNYKRQSKKMKVITSLVFPAAKLFLIWLEVIYLNNAYIGRMKVIHELGFIMGFHCYNFC